MQDILVQSNLPVRDAKRITFQDLDAATQVSIFSPHQEKFVEKRLKAALKIQQQIFDDKLAQESERNFTTGFRQGNSQAKIELSSQISQILSSFELVNNMLKASLKQLHEQEERQMLRLVIAIAKKVTQAEVRTNPSIIIDVLRDAMKMLADNRAIKILVNPEDWTIVQENLRSLETKIDYPQNVDVISDFTIEKGGCIIEYDAGSIDSTITSRIDEITRQLTTHEL